MHVFADQAVQNTSAVILAGFLTLIALALFALHRRRPEAPAPEWEWDGGLRIETDGGHAVLETQSETYRIPPIVARRMATAMAAASVHAERTGS